MVESWLAVGEADPVDVPSSPRLTFRRMTTADLDDMAGLLGDPAVMTYYPRPKTRDEAADWIRWNEANYARDGFGLWILHHEDGTFVGDCGLTWQTVDEIRRSGGSSRRVPPRGCRCAR